MLQSREDINVTMKLLTALCFVSCINCLSAQRNECKINVIETIPSGLFPNTSIISLSTYEAWNWLITIAERDINILSFYWSLLEEDTRRWPTSNEGRKVFSKLIQAGAKKNVSIHIVEDTTNGDGNTEVKYLVENAGAQARGINFTELVGSGVMHAKLWVVDSKHAYLGSANNDWRALTEVKELGFLLVDCPVAVADLVKTFKAYWLLAENNTIPDVWPSELGADHNYSSPLHLDINHLKSSVFFANAPPQINPPGMEDDLSAILNLISDANKYIYISVMDYFPRSLYHDDIIEYWPTIEDALKRATFERRVEIKLMVGYWATTRDDQKQYLRSYNALDGAMGYVSFQTRFFNVTSTPSQLEIPYARVNHAKYMVTDKAVHVGTSNWSKDYFFSTAGISMSILGRHSNVRKKCEDIFLRDWNSEYTFLPESI